MARTKTTKRRHNSSIDALNQSSRSSKQKKVAGASGSTDEDRPSTSTASIVRKKRGLSMRNGVQGENRQQKGRTPAKVHDSDMPKKSKRKKTGTSSRKSETERDDQYTERVVSAQRASKWKPMSKNTKEFVLASLDSSIVYTLNGTRASSYDDVQDSLNILRQRIVGGLSVVSVPSIARQPDYRNMEQQCHSMEVSVAEASNQVVLLEKEIQEQEREIAEKERLLEEMNATQKDQNHDNTRKINPILQGDTRNKLQLPAVKTTMVKGPKASSTTSSTSSSSHTKLVHALKKWQSQDTVQDIGTLMDTLSNITDNLQH